MSYDKAECGVCLEDVPVHCTIYCLGGHPLCEVCVREFFNRVIEGKDSYPARCCGASLSIETCAKFLESETLAKFEQFLREKAQSVGKDDEKERETDQKFVRDSIKKGELYANHTKLPSKGSN